MTTIAGAGPTASVPSQQRQPAGVASGGQFAGHAHSEPDVSLSPEVDDATYNADGSFAYPPFPRSAVQHIAFWTSVRVPDVILERVSNAYEANVAAWAGEQLAAWDQANPKPRVGFGGREADWEHARASYAAQLEDAHPPTLNPTIVRPLVRLAQMGWYAGLLPEQDRDEVLRREMTLPGGRQTTAAEVIDRYRFADIEHAFSLPDEVAELARLRDSVHEVTASVGLLQEEINRNWNVDRAEGR